MKGVRVKIGQVKIKAAVRISDLRIENMETVMERQLNSINETI